MVLARGSGGDEMEARHGGRRALPLGGVGGCRRAQRHDDRCATADTGVLRPTSAGSPSWRSSRPAQSIPKPTHLSSREEAAWPGLVNSTAYRQLISKNGAGMKLGDRVLIWGASGGLGSYATQMALAGGATPVCVVSSPEKAEIVRRMGAELIIDRSAEGYKFWNDEGSAQDPKEWQRLGKRIRELTGGYDVDIVFEHPGRETSAPRFMSRARAARSPRAPQRRAISTNTTTVISG